MGRIDEVRDRIGHAGAEGELAGRGRGCSNDRLFGRHIFHDSHAQVAEFAGASQSQACPALGFGAGEQGPVGLSESKRPNFHSAPFGGLEVVGGACAAGQVLFLAWAAAGAEAADISEQLLQDRGVVSG